MRTITLPLLEFLNSPRVMSMSVLIEATLEIAESSFAVLGSRCCLFAIWESNTVSWRVEIVSGLSLPDSGLTSPESEASLTTV